MPISAIARPTLKVRPRRGGGVASYFGGDVGAVESAVSDALRGLGVTGRSGAMAAIEAASDRLAVAGTINVGSGGTIVPLYRGKFDTGTVGQPCNAEYSGFNGGSNPIVYANDVVGPKGEALVGKIQLATGSSYYGGTVRLPRQINSQTGQEFWARAFFRISSQYCWGGKGNVEGVNGSLKWWRWFFDGNNRLTLLLGNPDGFSGAAGDGVCANPATGPTLGLFNSEVGTQNLYMFPANALVMTRDTWICICVYILWGPNNTGRVRCWFNDTLCLDAACSTRPVGSQYDVVASGFCLPGDYYNGQPVSANPMGHLSQVLILDSSSPPIWTDPAHAGFKFIPMSFDVRTLQ